MKQVVIASNNKGKIKEYEEMLSPYGYECLSLKDINFFEDIEENGSTFKENSYIKASTIHKLTNYPVISDDSGLCVDILNGAPGIYSHRYSGENPTDEKNRKKMISELPKYGIGPYTAHFTCAITYIDNEKEIQEEGYFYGEILLEERGTNGFGYDSLFYVKEFNRTVGEMSDDEKNSISHRHNALIKLIERLKEYDK